MNHELREFLSEAAHLIPSDDNKNYVIYTALFGSYDELKEPVERDPGALYICFTDNPSITSSTWHIVFVKTLPLDPRMSARALKLLPHHIFARYKTSVWVDAKCLIVKNPREFVELIYKENVGLGCCPHQVRKSVLSEALACLIRGYDSPLKIIQQFFSYVHDGFRDSDQLVETTILVRQHHAIDVIQFQEMWFQQVCTRSVRDQLSFNYSAWKLSFRYKLYSVPMSSYFEVKPHLLLGRYDSGQSLKMPIQRRIYNIIFRRDK